MSRFLLRCAAAGAFLIAACAQADVLVGEFRGSNPTDVGPLLRFAPGQNGNVAPLSALTTNLGGQVLVTPVYATYEPSERVIYVADFYGKAIRVYPANASGNVAPLRTITTEYLGQPRQLAVDVAHNEILVPVMGCCIGTFARNASGNVGFPSRLISWGGIAGNVTRLNSPISVALLPNDEIAVIDRAVISGVSHTVVLIFARTATGNTAPLRTIEGPNTRLGEFPGGIAYIPQTNEIAVAVQQSSAWQIVTLPASASGDVSPTRVIAGSNTTLESVTAVAYEPSNDLLYVATGAYSSSNPKLIAFPRTANGNIAPVRTLAGSNTGISQPYGLVAVPNDALFANGFQ
jgi:hypothetical protein